MSVQFLRLLHNFCDRDCDNHNVRRLLLSRAEREVIFSNSGRLVPANDVQPGLLSKVIRAFMTESDDSPYRFWLASCVESYLRGSSTQEQLFVAQSGLLLHLVEHVTSDRLHCAGSLQTSFDLLGELCKGNCELLQLLMSCLDELSFHRLMNVAASNLVDSNVFIRSLILSIERDAASQPVRDHLCTGDSQRSNSHWRGKAGWSSRFYLTHSWWDPVVLAIRLCQSSKHADEYPFGNDEGDCSDARPSDWFPPFHESRGSNVVNVPSGSLDRPSMDCHAWNFSPGAAVEAYMENEAACHLPNTFERLRWFVEVNRTQLLRDLLGVVNLGNINHENIW